MTYYWRRSTVENGEIVGVWVRLELKRETPKYIHFAYPDGTRPGETWRVARTTMQHYIRQNMMRAEP